MKETTSMFSEYADVVTVKQLQQMLNIGRSKVYSLLQSKEIKAKRIGRDYRIAKKSIIEFLEKN